MHTMDVLHALIIVIIVYALIILAFKVRLVPFGVLVALHCFILLAQYICDEEHMVHRFMHPQIFNTLLLVYGAVVTSEKSNMRRPLGLCLMVTALLGIFYTDTSIRYLLGMTTLAFFIGCATVESRR